MGTTIHPTVPVAQPAAEPWPVDKHTIRVASFNRLKKFFDSAFE